MTKQDQSGKEKEVATSASAFQGAISTVAHRLKSPPLLLAFGVILVLAAVITLTGEDPRPFIWSVLAIVGAALLVWLIVEIRGKGGHKRASSTSSDVDMEVGEVGEKGELLGLSDDAAGQGGPSRGTVKMKINRLDGSATGIKRGNPGKSKR